MGDRWIKVLDVVLRGGAGVALVLAALWVLGPNGANAFGPVYVPDGLRSLYGSSFLDWSNAPTFSARLTDTGPVLEVFARANLDLVAGSNGVAGGEANLYADPVISLHQPGIFPALAYLALHVLTLVTLAWVLWSLAGLVRSSATSTPFTAANAALLVRLGLVLAVGSVARSVVAVLVDSWLVESTNNAGLVDAYGYGVADVPITVLLAGLGAVVLGRVWQRGVLMERELEGLV